MIFEEEENQAPPKLRLPTMICDKSLGNIPEPFPCSHHFMVVCGAPGQGKTSFALGTYFKAGGPLRKKFNNVFAVVPPTSRGSVANEPFQKHNPKRMSEYFYTGSKSYRKLLGREVNNEKLVVLGPRVHASGMRRGESELRK